METTTKLPYLPQEVITEILFRSQARLLGRFRCVSKYFCSFLSDPNFVKKHLDQTLGNNTVRSGQRRLILALSSKLFAVNIDCIRDGCENIKDLTCVELNYPLKDGDFLTQLNKKAGLKYLVDPKKYKGGVHIFGSSRGLVCISSNFVDFFLYNPTTGESKRLPDLPKSLLSKSYGLTWFRYGFGFDSLTNDYKVVKLREHCNYDYVYSLKTDSWREIYNLPYTDVQPSSPVELNGAIHWISKPYGKAPEVVIAFDLKTDKFRDMSLPDLAEEDNHVYWKSSMVGTLKGRLCIVPSWFGKCDVIWVMNEYGLESSWSKIRISVPYRSVKPLCSIKNDNEKVLLVLDGHLVLYNFESNTCRKLEICCVGSGGLVQADTFVESLISPNSYSIYRDEKRELLYSLI